MVLPSRQQGESYTLIKPGRLHLDVTGGEALGQNIASSLTRSCLEGSTPASHGTALQAAGSKLPLIPKASPPVTKSKALQAFLPIMAFPSPKQSHLALNADIIEGADYDENF